jgi:hypothetical protein
VTDSTHFWRRLRGSGYTGYGEVARPALTALIPPLDVVAYLYENFDIQF